VARFGFQHNNRAIINCKTGGLVKVMVVRGRPVGASIAGIQAGELSSPRSLAIANNLNTGQSAAMAAPIQPQARETNASQGPVCFRNSLIP